MADFRKNLIAGLRRALQQSNALSQADQDTFMSEVEQAHDDEPPPTLVIIGETGVGKTTTLNSLFGAGQPVGHTRATTIDPVALTVRPRPITGSKGEIRVIDMPGVGDDRTTYPKYRVAYQRALEQADAVLWIHPAEDRMVAYLQEVLIDLFGERDFAAGPGLVFGLNKADEMSPHDWNPVANVPSDKQVSNLQDREAGFSESVRSVLPHWSGRAVAYSALRRYKLAALFRELMEAVSEPRKWVVEDRMDLADFTALVDRGLLDAVVDGDLGPASEPSDDPAPVVAPPHEAAAEHPSPELEPGLEHELANLSDEEYQALVSDRLRLLRWLAQRRRKS